MRGFHVPIFRGPGPIFFFPGQELRNELEEAMAEAPYVDPIEQRAKSGTFRTATEAHLWLAEIRGFLYCFPSFSFMPHAHLKDKID